MVAKHQRDKSERGRAPMRRPDVVVRALHAWLALTFLGGWLTAEWAGLRAWHVALGHALALAWLLRMGWSLAQPRASVGRWLHRVVGAARRLRSGRLGEMAPATWSVGGLALVVCVILALIPVCFVTGFALDRLGVSPGGNLVNWHHWLGDALMVAVASHLALLAVLSVMRERCMACSVLPGGSGRSRDSADR